MLSPLFVIGSNGDAFEDWPTGPSVYEEELIRRLGRTDENADGEEIVVVDDDGEVVARGLPSRALAEKLAADWNHSRARRRWKKPYRAETRAA